MNLNVQYSIIGGSAAAFIIVLLAFFLPPTSEEPIPIAPVGVEITANQTIDTNDDGSVDNENSIDIGILGEMPSPSELDEIEDSEIEPTPTPVSPSGNEESSSSGGGGSGSGGRSSSSSGGGGGGGGNSGSNDGGDDDKDDDPCVWGTFESRTCDH